MRFSLIKAIKSTHRTPANKILHGFGLSIYAVAIMIILSNYLLKSFLNPFMIVLLFTAAIALFLLGHKIEGNIKATTWVVVFKYLREYFKKYLKDKPYDSKI
jgi:hypothetical protein